ncbi:MAG: WG repeat-containing protein [Bacteroidota bacterium]
MKKILLFLCLVLPCFIYAQQLLPIKKNQRWGLINEQGRIQLNPKYHAISKFDRYGYANIQKDGQIGLLSQNGREVIPPKYDDVKVIGKNYFAVLEKNIWRLLNKQKKAILTDFEDAEVWSNQGITFLRDDKWGFIDFSGKMLVQPLYDAIEPQNHFIITQQDTQFGLHLKSGRRVLTPTATDLQAVGEQVFLYKKEGLWGAIDHTGQSLFSPEYQQYKLIEPTSIQLKQGANTLLYSLDSEQLIKGYFYEQFLPFSKELLLVQQRQKFGLIDRMGNIVISPRFDEIRPFNESYLRVQKDGLWGIVNIKGTEVLPLFFDYIAPLNTWTSLVKKGNQYGIIDQYAQIGIPIDYDKIVLEDRQIKAYKDESLSMFTIGEDGTINQEHGNFGEHITFRIGGAKRATKANNAENALQLEQFEWFYQQASKRWGLRNSVNGEVTIEAQFDFIEVKEDIGFTLVGLKKRNRQTFHQTTYGFEMIYGLVSNTIGKLITPMEFLHVAFEDFENGASVARCVFANGKHGLINQIGQVIERDAAFIDKFEDGVARIGVYGTLSGVTTGKGLLPLKTYLSELTAPNYMIDYTSDNQYFRDYARLVCQDCAWGYIDTLGVMVINTQYEAVKHYSNGFALAKQNGKWGMVNQKDKIIVPFQFDEIDFLEHSNNKILKVHRQSYRYGLMDTLGHIAVDALYEDIGIFSENRLAVKQEGRWGFTNTNGKLIIPCRFQQVHAFSNGLAAAKKDGQWGFIDLQGNTVLPFQYGKVGNFKEGMVWVRTSEGIQYINAKGQKMIAGSFDRAFDFKYGVARVVEAQRFGLIDQTGQYLIRPKFIHIGEFDDNALAIVKYGQEKVRYGILDTKGNIITEHHYNEIKPYSEDRAIVKLKDQYGYIDSDGKLVIPTIYSKVGPFVEGRAAVQENGNCGYINTYGAVVVELAYSKCLEFNSGRAVVYKGYRKAGLLSETGEHIIQPSLNRLINFKNGRGLMRDDNYRFYFITEDANVFDGYYQEALNFKHGVAVVRSGDKWGIVNRKGIKIIPPKYDKIEPFKDAYAKVRIRGFYGLYDLKGQAILPVTYERIQAINERIFSVEQGNRIGYLDSRGTWVWEMQD